MEAVVVRIVCIGEYPCADDQAGITRIAYGDVYGFVITDCLVYRVYVVAHCQKSGILLYDQDGKF